MFSDSVFIFSAKPSQAKFHMFSCFLTRSCLPRRSRHRNVGSPEPSRCIKLTDQHASRRFVQESLTESFRKPLKVNENVNRFKLTYELIRKARRLTGLSRTHIFSLGQSTSNLGAGSCPQQ